MSILQTDYVVIITDESKASRDILVKYLNAGSVIIESTGAGKMKIQYVLAIDKQALVDLLKKDSDEVAARIAEQELKQKKKEADLKAEKLRLENDNNN